jgi:hypothetical protein
MATTCTIGGVSVTMIEDMHDITKSLDERGRFQCDVIDYTGTFHFSRGERVVVTDPILGIIYNGFLSTDKEVPLYPSGAILHSIDCIDIRYIADKRTYTQQYLLPTYAGKILVDMAQNILVAEGLQQNFALHEDDTTANFNTGILSNTIGVGNVGNGDLELAKAGNNVTITEAKTAQFATGTLTNCTAINNSLRPTTVSGIKTTAYLPFTNGAASLNLQIWSGSQALGTNDTFNFDIFIVGTSPQITASLQIIFSDGTVASSLVDQNALSIAATTDLSIYAKDMWYTRNFSTTAYNGKTIISVFITFGGTSAGTYTAFFKNIYLTSGPIFFATNATATQVDPPVVTGYLYYSLQLTTSIVLPVCDALSATRTSPVYTISTVNILGSSYVTWIADTTFSCVASYDGGITYLPLANNSLLPSLPNGSNISGNSLTLKELFSGIKDPSIIPTLSSMIITLTSAPNVTKSDIIATYATQAAFNAGTYTNTVASSGGDLFLATTTDNWLANGTTGMTFHAGTYGGSQSTSGNIFILNVNVNNVSIHNNDNYCTSQLSFLGSWTDFDFNVGLLDFISPAPSYIGVTYRTTNFAPNQAAGYLLLISSFGSLSPPYYVQLYKGTSPDTTIAGTLLVTGSSSSIIGNLRILVRGNVHIIFVNKSTSPSIIAYDSTYSSGSFGFFGGSGPDSSAYTGLWRFYSLIIQHPTSTWLSPATSVSSLTTCGPSAIFWTEANTGIGSQGTVLVQSSVDGGSTYQNCTNGGTIANIPSGTNVVGKNVKLLISLSTGNPYVSPILRQLVLRVLGQYPTVSGTRSTQPQANDMSITRTVGSGWGTSFGGETITQIGTGTTSVGSNVALISSTTGDVHMEYGSRTSDNAEATLRFTLSNSSTTCGLELRYVDTNNYYRLAATQNSIAIIMRIAGTNTTVLSATPTIAINTQYRMRFRVTSTDPTGSLFGKVWANNSLEPIAWTLFV